MSVAIVLLLAALAILPEQAHDHQISVVTAQQMKEWEIFLGEKMTRLWEDVQRIRALEEAPLLSTLQHWPFWAATATLLAELCWLAWRWKAASGSCPEQDSSSTEEEDKDKDDGKDLDEEEDFSRACRGVRSLLWSVPPPVQLLPEACRNLKQLMCDLLFVSREFSQRTFMPEVYPDTGRDGSRESWSVCKHQIFYQLLVFRRPPPGHSFILDEDAWWQQPEPCSDMCVELECTCSREHLMGLTLCFLHSTDKELPKDQRSPLLCSLCTGSSLEVERVASWVQNLVEAAWWRLPHWLHQHLRLLPTSRSCKFLLISPSQRKSCIELCFALQQGSSDSFLNPEQAATSFPNVLV